MKKVFVNGYGSIGSRITAFLKDDPEISVVGVGKYSPDDDVNVAISRGLNVYVPEKKLDEFKDFKISGSIESALDQSDLVIDAAPADMDTKTRKICTNHVIFLQFTKVENLQLVMKQFLIYCLTLGQTMILQLENPMSCRVAAMLLEWEEFLNH